MKPFSIVLSFFLISITGLMAQNSVDERTSEVMAIVDEHSPVLEEYQKKMAEHKAHLEERIIVLKYHKGNKEVVEACAIVVNRVEEFYNEVTQKVQDYESVWFDQTRNIVAIYTRYGELVEATGGGANDLQNFADRHSRYLDLLENVKSDLLGVYTDINFIKNSI